MNSHNRSVLSLPDQPIPTTDRCCHYQIIEISLPIGVVTTRTMNYHYRSVHRSYPDLVGLRRSRGGSFCCSGKRQVARQAKDHPKAAYEAWHTAWRYPFRARRDWQSQAHLHTTLNKSRDEKLEIVGAGATYAFGKRDCIMGEGAKTTRSVGNRTRWDPGFGAPDVLIWSPCVT